MTLCVSLTIVTGMEQSKNPVKKCSIKPSKQEDSKTKIDSKKQKNEDDAESNKKDKPDEDDKLNYSLMTLAKDTDPLDMKILRYW